MRITLSVLFLLMTATIASSEDKIPDESVNRGYSGMARLSDVTKPGRTEYLVVHDRKDKPSHKRYAWTGVLTWTAGEANSWRPLHVTPPVGVSPPNDLEACCRVPGMKNWFLLAESGYFKPKTGPLKGGRVILVSLHLNKATPPAWGLQWRGSFEPFLPPTDLDDKSLHIEGMRCLPHSKDKFVLVLGTLGLKGKSSTLTWGLLDLSDPKAPDFVELDRATLTPGDGPLGARSCGDLFLKPAANRIDQFVWSVATTDPGDAGGNGDGGPFRSKVFLAGKLTRIRGPKLYSYRALCAPTHLWTVEGIKIEALARPPTGLAQAGLVYASDDEDYVGVWRPLRARK